MNMQSVLGQPEAVDPEAPMSVVVNLRPRRHSSVTFETSATVLPFPAVKPAQWTGWHEHLYEHFQRCDGLTPKEARARVEQEIADQRAAEALPQCERLGFLMRMALSRLPGTADC